MRARLPMPTHIAAMRLRDHGYRPEQLRQDTSLTAALCRTVTGTPWRYSELPIETDENIAQIRAELSRLTRTQ